MPKHHAMYAIMAAALSTVRAAGFSIVLAYVGAGASLTMFACSSPSVSDAASVPGNVSAAATRTLPGTDKRTYRVFLAGTAVGEQITQPIAGDTWEVTYSFRDRGRGPTLKSRIVLDHSGIPRLLETSGHNYLKSPVNERFEHAESGVRWHSNVESGSLEDGSERVRRGFYLAAEQTPEDFALLARALLAAPENTLPLLPAGSATLRMVERRSVTNATGQQKEIIQYAIVGIGFSPVRIWLDRDGRSFASAAPWFSVIEDGFEAELDTLLAAQQQADDALAKERMNTLAQHPQQALAFTNVAVFDAEMQRMVPAQTVLVNGDRITAVGPSVEIEIPASATVIDGAGKSLLPGLWDMHVHYGGPDDGLLHIAAGVTSVRDLANDTDTLLRHRDNIEAGHSIGPRLVLGGFMDGPGPYAGPTKVLVDNMDEVRAAIDRYAELGYEQIKIYSSIDIALVPDIIDYAHARKLRVSGHIPAFMTAAQAAAHGLDEIQHINFIVLNFLFDKVQDTRTPARFTAVAEHAASLDLDSPEVQAFIAELVKRQVVVDPTVSIFEGMFTDRAGQMSAVYAPIADRLPVQIRRSLFAGGLPMEDADVPGYRASYETLLALIGRLHEAGVQLVAGTDALAGFALHRELENYVRAGIPAPAVLRIATLDAARVTGRDAELGTIAPGKIADLVLVNGNPAADISDIRNTELSVRGGVIFRAEALYRALGVQPR